MFIINSEINKTPIESCINKATYLLRAPASLSNDSFISFEISIHQLMLNSKKKSLQFIAAIYNPSGIKSVYILFLIILPFKLFFHYLWNMNEAEYYNLTSIQNGLLDTMYDHV